MLPLSLEALSLTQRQAGLGVTTAVPRVAPGCELVLREPTSPNEAGHRPGRVLLLPGLLNGAGWRPSWGVRGPGV